MRTRTFALSLTLAATVLTGCGPTPAPDPSPATQSAQETVARVYPDGLTGVEIPDGYVALSSGVPAAALVPADADPASPEVTAVIVELLETSMYTPQGDQAFALELMHAAILSSVATQLFDAYGQALTVAYPTAGADGPWTVTTYDPQTKLLSPTPDLTRAEADDAAVNAPGIVVVLEKLNS